MVVTQKTQNFLAGKFPMLFFLFRHDILETKNFVTKRVQTVKTIWFILGKNSRI